MNTRICFTEVQIHPVHPRVNPSLRWGSLYRPQGQAISSFHYMTMRPRGTRSVLQQTCRCSPQSLGASRRRLAV